MRPCVSGAALATQVAVNNYAAMKWRRLKRALSPGLAGLLSGLLVVVGGARAQDSPPSEYQLKAAFLYNFAKFIEWPPKSFIAPEAPMVIGVLGENPFGDTLEQTLRGKSLNNHPLAVKPISSLVEATNCHILFICASEQNRLAEIIHLVKGTSILTVAEMDRFTESGGMIQFVPEGNKIRFQINDEAAKTANLKISSKLLSLALRSTH